jgi:hypothetical protein
MATSMATWRWSGCLTDSLRAHLVHVARRGSHQLDRKGWPDLDDVLKRPAPNEKAGVQYQSSTRRSGIEPSRRPSSCVTRTASFSMAVAASKRSIVPRGPFVFRALSEDADLGVDPSGAPGDGVYVEELDLPFDPCIVLLAPPGVLRAVVHLGHGEDARCHPSAGGCAVEMLAAATHSVQGIDDRGGVEQPDHSRSGSARPRSRPSRRIRTSSSVDSPCHGPSAAIRSPRLRWSGAPEMTPGSARRTSTARPSTTRCTGVDGSRRSSAHSLFQRLGDPLLWPRHGESLARAGRRAGGAWRGNA